MKTNHLKIAFFGTPELTLHILDALAKSDLTPSLIVTNKDMPKGRNLVMMTPPAKLWAITHAIPCLQPEKIDEDFMRIFEKETFDISVVVAYGKIMPAKLIEMPKHGTINVHYSLLPKYRGATPVESAILNGDTETGVCIQKMAFALDTGDILGLEHIAIPPKITAFDLREELNRKAAIMLPTIIKEYVSGEITPIPQNEQLASHCKKIKKEDGLIDIHGDSIMNDRTFRAYSVWPRTYFFACLKNDPTKKIRVIISDAQLEQNTFIIKKVIPEGKKEMSFQQFETTHRC